MALYFDSYEMSSIIVIVYDESIVIVYVVSLLLSMTYQFQSRLGKTDGTDLWAIKATNQVLPSSGDFGFLIGSHLMVVNWQLL